MGRLMAHYFLFFFSPPLLLTDHRLKYAYLELGCRQPTIHMALRNLLLNLLVLAGHL